MIREDRIELNDRFIKVFNLLVERGDIILNDRNGKGVGDFAEKILGNRAYGHIIRAFLNSDDKRVIDYRHARVLCSEYGVNEEYMIDGLGTPFGFDIPNTKRGDDYSSKANILYTSVNAFAGSAVDVGGFSREDNQYFSVPGLNGNGLVAFDIEGNSMLPMIHNGDIVVCREVRSMSEIKDNDMYAVKNNGQLWVKYVQRLYNNRNRVHALKLISANYLEHEPFTEDVNEHTRLYKVIRRISNIN